MTAKEKNLNKKIRPPVVVIVGHVDHGKTSILDYIRKSKVAEKESGGITQHIGAYQVIQGDKIITFIDTPGHEAFSAMRSRGVQVADIAVLVVAADDGVSKQTKEAISIIKKAGLPFIVAINKTDKPEADVQKVKNQLTENNVLLEGYGGKVPSVEISAKTGQGIEALLDIINLVAELEEFSCDLDESVEAAVIESALDSKSGATATLLVTKGTLKVGSIIAGSSTWAKVKNMKDFLNKEMQEASPSTPVFVLGFTSTPRLGEKFVEVATINEAEQRIASKQRKSEEVKLVWQEGKQKIVNIVLKADVEGTLEAIHSVLRSIDNEELKLRILLEGVGDITDSDARLAQDGRALIVGFRVAATLPAQSLMRAQEVNIVTFSTVYDLVSGVRQAITSYIKPEIVDELVGKLHVLRIFRTEVSRMIVGGRVVEGNLKSGLNLKVFRNEEEIGSGRLKQLKKIDKEIGSAKKGEEVGVLFDGSIKLEQGDILEAWEKNKKHLTINL